MRMKRLSILSLCILTGCGNNTVQTSSGSANSAVATGAASSAPAATLSAPASSASSSAQAPETASSAPDVVATASPGYEAGPSVMTAGSVDGAALRKRHVDRMKSDSSAVTLLAGKGPLELGKRICEAAVPKRPKATPVLLKPNLCGFDGVKDPAKFKGDDGVTGRVTQPEFMRGVVQCLKERGHTKITIAEGCGHSHKFWKDLIKMTGYEAMAAEENVALVAMDDDGVYDVEGDKPGKPMAISGIGKTSVPNLLLPKVLAEHLDQGLFISVPKLKAHRYSVISVAIKGMQGTVMLSDSSPAYKQKWRMHRELKEYLTKKKEGDEDRALYVSTLRTFAERMVDVLEISAPDAVLVDGSPAMAGDGFQLMVPSAEMVAIGGTNPVRVDQVAAQFMGVWDSAALARELGGHRTSPLIDAAQKRFKLDLKSTVVEGDGADLLKSPRPVHFKAMAPFRLDWDPGQAPLAGGPPKGVPTAPLPAQPETPAGNSGNTKKLEAIAAALGANEEPVIDGKGNDAAWAKAKALQWNTDYAGAATGYSTKARFLWSKKGLFVLFELSGAGFFTDQSKPVKEERKALWQEDCVELFLTPDPNAPKRYFEVEIGPFGHFFDLSIDKENNKSDTAWSAGLQIGTTRDENAKTALIEVLLSAPDIVNVLKAGARLPMNLYRMEGKDPRNYLAWSPPRTKKPNFHVPEAFGVLVLE